MFDLSFNKDESFFCCDLRKRSLIWKNVSQKKTEGHVRRGGHLHLYNTKLFITIANVYIPPRDSTSTHYKTQKDIQHCIQHITTIPQSVLTGDVNAHSSLWHSYTDDHRGQLIAKVISNSDHISLNTDTPTRVPNTAFQQTSSLDITTVSNTLYDQTS